MGSLIDLLQLIITIAVDWRFWAWFIPGAILAAVAYNLSSNDFVSTAGAVIILVYFGWRGIRADRELR